MNHKSKRKIGFDLDDVLLNFSDALRIHLNNIFQKNFERSHVTSFRIENVYGITGEEMRKIINNFYLHDDHLRAEPMEGSKIALSKLAEDNTIYVVTAKPDHLEKITLNWINKHFPNIFREIHFANHFSDLSKKRYKSEICIENGIEIFVDDALDNAIELAGKGIPVLMPDRPWNQANDLPPLVTRVYSWEEIIQKLDKSLL